ncbi:monovalent cation:proton antiporter-2 (CPA2) family protein [Acidisphaera rubrifaciens]|nr:monovalent cation:proton antiporter-2 (CPA2) family protein [Acidisphaera rubrifaciens]
MLTTLVALLAAVAVAVPISRRLGFGSVLGYLVAGVAIGPQGLGAVLDTGRVQAISEFGVVMLLFLIGLEVRPQRLWVMRRAIFGLGSAQVVLSAAVLGAFAWIAGAEVDSAAVLGAGFALSSTAIVLPMLGERGLLKTTAGRDVFAVLLFQDLAFIPFVAVLPLLAQESLPDHVPWHDVGRAVLTVALILLIGRVVVPRAFRLIGGARTPEVFTAMALLIVLGTGLLAHEAGLSMSLGAFIAGVLLSDNEYRHELQADIEPFEGLLLGFFFMSVGMQTDLRLAAHNPGTLAAGVVMLLLAKTGIAYAIGRVGGQRPRDAMRFALALPQGSEFSFVLFAAAVPVGALTDDQATFATLVAAVSMAATPLLFAASEKLLMPRLAGRTKAPPPPLPVLQGTSPVLICGFGRVGQVAGRILRMSGIGFAALDRDPTEVEVARRFGSRVFYGDPTRPEVLRAAGAGEARVLIVALDDIEATLRIVEIARRQFPHLFVLARARNRRHAHLLMDRGVDGFVRDTFYSTLKLTEMALRELGMTEAEASRTTELFRQHDEQQLRDTHGFYTDEQQLRQSAQQAAEELAALFEADERTPSRLRADMVTDR